MDAIVVETVKKRWFSRKLVLVVGIVLLICVLSAAAYMLFIRSKPHTASTTTTAKMTQATLLDNYNKQQAALKKDPTNESLKLKNASAESALLNYYLSTKQYDKASALTAGQSSLQDLQMKAIIAEEKGDKQTAITALNAQIAYYKALPTTDTNYDMEISNIQTHITSLEQQ